MLKVVITIEDLKFTDTQKNNFTAVILDEKTGIYTHLGGEFSDDGKTFIFYSPYSGDYTLIVSENLKKINTTT